MKRFAVISLAFASTLLVLSASAFALDPSQQLEAGDAQLIHNLDTVSAMKGQLVTAKLTQTIETPEGVKLPNGTRLLGYVAQVQPSRDKSPARLALTFDKAQLKNGKEFPIKATLVQVSPAGAAADMQEKVAANDSFDQEEGILSGVSMHSAVQDQNSGMLMSRDRNIHLEAGTQMQIAVAPEPETATTGAGS